MSGLVPLLQPLPDSTKMGPGLAFLLLHLDCGDREVGAGFASCSSYQSIIVTSLYGLDVSPHPSP